MWIWLMVDVALRSAYCTRFMQVFLELISNRPWLLGSSSSSFSDCLEEIFLCVVGRQLRWCLYDPLVLPETLKELKNPLVTFAMMFNKCVSKVLRELFTSSHCDMFAA